MKSKVAERMLANTPDWVKQKVDSYAKLLLSDISDSLPLCNHEYVERDKYWCSCEHCGKIVPNDQIMAFVYEFLYNSDTWESSASTISIHRTKKGVISAMNKHKDNIKKEWESECKKYPSAKEFPFDYGQWWGFKKTKVLD